MSDPTDRDPLLDEYLKGDSEISRAYREASEELPPAHLDARILSEARRADAPLPKAPGPFSNRWMVPASVAVMVVAVSIVALLPQTQMHLKDVSEYERESAIGGGKFERSIDEPATVAPAETMSDTATGDGRLDLRESTEPPRDVLKSLNVAPEKKDADAAFPSSAPAAAPPAMEQEMTPLENRVVPAEPAGSAGTAVIERAPSISAPQMDGAPSRRELDEASARKKLIRSRQAKELMRSRPRAQGDTISGIGRALPEPAPETVSPSSAGETSLIPTDAAARLEKITTLIARGDMEAAAAELRTLRNLYPEVKIPPAILSALDARTP